MSSKRDRYRKFAARSTEQAASISGKSLKVKENKIMSKDDYKKRPVTINEESDEDKKTSPNREENKGSEDPFFFNPLLSKYPEHDSKEDEKPKLKDIDLFHRPSENPKLKKKLSTEATIKRRGSMRKNVFDNSLFTDNLALGDSLFMPNKLNRNKSTMPKKEMQFDDSSSEASDPEIKKLKRRAAICCKYTTECMLIIGILGASAIDFNVLSLMYFLGGLLMLLERINLSIKSRNEGQEAITNAFLISIPVLLMYKIISCLFIYGDFTKYQIIYSLKHFLEKNVLFLNFHSVSIYSGVVFIKENSFINLIITIIPEVFIGAFLIALNYVSSETLEPQYLNRHDFIEEKRLALGSTSFSILFILSIEYLSVVNISYIGVFFQFVVLYTVCIFAFKKDNRMRYIDFVCAFSMFLCAFQLILLFLNKIELIPTKEVEFIYFFIGAHQDKSKINTFMHATGALCVIVFGIIYLRARRIDYMKEISQPLDSPMMSPEGIPYNLKINESNHSPFLPEKDECLDETEDQEEKFFVWRIYDKIINAFTSEFVVLNLCRLGLCFWILRYNCIESIFVVIFLFHSTLVKSMIVFLPFVKYIYMPYMCVNVIVFYIINILYSKQGHYNTNIHNVKYGIIVFETPIIEFPLMLFVLLLVALLVKKMSSISEVLSVEDEHVMFQKKKAKAIKEMQNRNTILSAIYYLFYLSIEVLLLFILLMNVVSKVNLSNFCLNLYLVMYLIYPSLARKHIRKFLFVVEGFNLVNYVYAIFIASSDGSFFAGEVGNFIGIDSYDVYMRKYFNTIPTLRIVALIIVTMTVWNTLPTDVDEDIGDQSDFEGKLYKTLYSYSRCFTESIYLFISVIKKLTIWICYALIFLILIANDLSIKNWVAAILIAFIIYKHLSSGVYYLNYFATYAGFMFITTWMFQFLKFDIITDIFKLDDINHLPFHSEIWGYTVLSEKQLLFRVVALSAMLVLSVIGYRAIIAQSQKIPLFINLDDTESIKEMDESILYKTILEKREEIFWSTTSIFLPIINFIATFFHIPVIFVIMWQALYWKLSWMMILFIFFAIGPWYTLDIDRLQTKNKGKVRSLLYYSNIVVREQRYKKWKTLTLLCLLAWIIIFPSHKLLQLLNIKYRTQAIFFGEWSGLLYPGTNKNLIFSNYVSGYMIILCVLVIEKKLLECLDNENSGAVNSGSDQSASDIESHVMYKALKKEIDRREEQQKLKEKGKKKGTVVAFEGIDEDGKIEVKQQLKKILNDGLKTIKKGDKKNPVKSGLSSALKKSSLKIPECPDLKEETKKETRSPGHRSLDESDDQLEKEREADDSEFNLFFTENNPHRMENKRLLLFQYKIKFMRGAKIFIEESMTFALMICALYKDNILSLMYYWMAIKMILEKVDMHYRMKAITYVSIFTLVQYFLCLTNWNKNNSPQPLPIPFNPDIRGEHEYKDYISPPLELPWVDQMGITDIWKKYLMIDKNSDILHSLMIETILLCIGAIYFYTFSPYLYNIKKKELKNILKLKADVGKDRVFLDYVQSSSIFATVYKGMKSTLYNTCHIFLILILLVLTSQNSGVLAIGYLIFALFYLYKSLDLLMDKYWDYPDGIQKFKYYIISDCALCIIYQLPFFYLHYRENYFNSLQAFIGLESFWIEYSQSWNTRALVCMLLKFLALCFIHLQGKLFSTDDYSAHRQALSKKPFTRNKAKCMAYLHNNKKIKKEREIQIIKRSMKLKLELIQEQLGGTKFGHIAEGGLGFGETATPVETKKKPNPFVYDSSDSDNGMMGVPQLRNAVSSYDPELMQKEEKKLKKKLQELEKNEQGLELFQEFTEIEQKELSKLDTLTKIFLFLRRNITNPIISCDEVDIQYAVKDFQAGALHCQNRIERIGKKLVKSGREKKVLKGLTERKTMIFNIFSTFIYFLISNTAALSYMFMFLNCMCTGNLISLFYPLSVLMYALIEDPRPRSKYWSIILIYAEIVILFKFLIQQNALTVLTPGTLFVEIIDKFKIGFRVFDKKEYAKGIFGFIIWDILVALSVVLHQHFLVLIGLWKKRECDFESVSEGRKRLLHQERRAKYERNLKNTAKVPPTIMEDDKEYDKEDDKEEVKEETNEKPKRIRFASISSSDDVPSSEISQKARKKLGEFGKEVSMVIPKLKSIKDPDVRRVKPLRRTSSQNFPYGRLSDDTSELEEYKDHFSPNYFIHECDSDNDGGSIKSCDARMQYPTSEKYSEIELDPKNNSEEDLKYYREIDDEGIYGIQNALTIDHIKENPEIYKPKRKEDLQSLILENDFIRRVFPASKDEKPGYDFYNFGVIFQFLVVIYILFFFSQMTGEYEELSETFKFKRFRTEMIFFMFVQIMLILLDRFFYISNTFDQIKSDSDESGSEDINVLNSENRHNLLKLLIYYFLVILVHATVIWYFPLTGNYKISEQIYCDSNGPCNDLQDNIFLWGFYILYLGYFCMTALQFRYGLPEIRKGHFMYERVSFFYTQAFRFFFWIPFLFEVKTFIDWTFTKTSLKIWKWFTFETIYSEFYEAKIGEVMDKDRKIGELQSWFEKLTLGIPGILFCLGLILAPLIIFSSLNPIAELNLVKGAGIELNIELEEGKSLYNLFATTVANEIRNLTEEEFGLLNFRKYKELRISDHSLYQRVEMLPYSDRIWNLSPPAIRKMKEYFEKAMKTNSSEAAIALEYSFNRKYPSGPTKLYYKKRIMDLDNYPEIFKSFYEALNSTQCKPVYIKLDKIYPSVIHLTNEVEPEIIPIKFKTINIKIFCTSDPLIVGSTVKYWTMSIEDDLDIARRKLKEQEHNSEPKFSMKLPPGVTNDYEGFDEGNSERMGIFDYEPSNNQQIIESGAKDSDYGLEKSNENSSISKSETKEEIVKNQNEGSKDDQSKDMKLKVNLDESVITSSEYISKEPPVLTEIQSTTHPSNPPPSLNTTLSSLSMPLNTSISTSNTTSVSLEIPSSIKPTNRNLKKPLDLNQTLSSSSQGPLRDLHQAGEEINVSKDPKIMKITETKVVPEEDLMRLDLNYTKNGANSNDEKETSHEQNLSDSSSDLEDKEQAKAEQVQVQAENVDEEDDNIQNQADGSVEEEINKPTAEDESEDIHKQEEAPHVIDLDIPTIDKAPIINPAQIITGDSELWKKILNKQNEDEARHNLTSHKETISLAHADQISNEPKKVAPNPTPYAPEGLSDSKEMNEENFGEGAHQRKQVKDEADSAKQMGLVIYTLSDKITPGLLQYSVITFYVSVVFVASRVLRGYLWSDTSKIYLSDLPYPDELLIICEGVVISRMQKDIYREEELYLVLIDLIRSPEILKMITHPHLKPKTD
ncbi:unnamed protein product [Moneuplotes crassus]|uniref:Piezo-type mechanosensitive ion channel component n=2 Tax=Euplotes crassus TaxID=5936 RepID=A0AAD2DA54_EUPCR|nr:unnamed protein product [Moneuplotes crassus]